MPKEKYRFVTYTFTFDNPRHRRIFSIFWHGFLLVLLCLTLLAPLISSALSPLQEGIVVGLIGMAFFFTSPVFKALRQVPAVKATAWVILLGIECLAFAFAGLKQPSLFLEFLMMVSGAWLISMQVYTVLRSRKHV
ncbi:MAG TPA: hypothetical protein VKV19_12830 [Ktedonobacteraceae bacterium]|nr:hypothetical protein [Ktedonobacteraceae bacterium]